MSIRDPWDDARAAGWRVADCAQFGAARRYEADVAIVGTGAGGGVSAEILARAGLEVILVEEGPLATSRRFTMEEARAYPELYQESAARKTRDKAINILQGRCVGGSTTVNWTSSFRTPPATLEFWRRSFGAGELTDEALAPWFAAVERRLSIRPWDLAPNANNAAFARGASALGIPVAVISRNVEGCWNLGYCGMGCPTNAKRSMLVTTLPAALARGARLLTRLRAQRLAIRGGWVRSLECRAMDAGGIQAGGAAVTIVARHYVLAAGALGSPALLLRSRAPDPNGVLGRRTFLHPTVIAAAKMPERVAGWAGAPQTVYSDHFLEENPIDGALGFKLEVPPLHPVLVSTTLQGMGGAHAALMGDLPHTHVLLALMRDGFHPQDAGGTVGLREDGSPQLDYPLHAPFWEAARRAFLAMARIQFAAGALRVLPVHEHCGGYANWEEARSGIGSLALEPLLTRVVSAHVMGGCGLSGDAGQGVVRPDGRHHQLANCSVFDGSVFPTSVGANPQLSIYALAARNASALAESLSGRAAPALA
ncbi:MAG TPA: GMC family oxidoreductase [Rhodocyclaceae bacterium]|nr:MAG: GMC family oxidoreductase [Rhodocyclales bacterium CG_4_10_14_3_um_filter_68_10]PJA57060.1 MAG: GMC family oxidoreductase [Rhodocyclales bacterium CG_4_9_14_3_um_filter_68_10]HCX34834.1 GMC family oxidoreductase [Rhodocyclaceae bacterium]